MVIVAALVNKIRRFIIHQMLPTTDGPEPTLNKLAGSLTYFLSYFRKSFKKQSHMNIHLSLLRILMVMNATRPFYLGTVL